MNPTAYRFGLLPHLLAVSFLFMGCGGGDGVSSLVFGEYDLFYDVRVDHQICEDGQWTADITLRCSVCDAGISSHVIPTKVGVYLWQYSQDLWTKSERLSLSLDTQTSHTVDLSALGATCGDVDTAVVLVPTGPMTYGSPEVEGLNRGGGNGGGMIGKGNGLKIADYKFYCNPDLAVRAEAVLYNYVAMKKTKTITLSPPTGEDDQGKETWTAEGSTMEFSSHILVLLGYDAQDVIQCSTFL